jgi:hypothetical protein
MAIQQGFQMSILFTASGPLGRVTAFYDDTDGGCDRFEFHNNHTEDELIFEIRDESGGPGIQTITIQPNTPSQTVNPTGQIANPSVIDMRKYGPEDDDDLPGTNPTEWLAELGF